MTKGTFRLVKVVEIESSKTHLLCVLWSEHHHITTVFIPHHLPEPGHSVLTRSITDNELFGLEVAVKKVGAVVVHGASTGPMDCQVCVCVCVFVSVQVLKNGSHVEFVYV